ncbi:MAG: UDP-N-acetylmuramoyl-L-alanyl-D-glutamate--2,6-diaminopimelate ligase [Bacilli bacterium]|nr:UDP-N-acetylmuramoyl-L-alanyl-D-glutamate--2,6-diaminopimelate ligase [Bacilli bacterium]
MLNIKTDSRKVVKGDTFIALKGNTVDGHDFIDSAIKNGAEKIICEHGKYDVDTINVSDTHEYLKDYLVNNYSKEFEDLKLIGVTGTSGKTTTCFLTYQILNKLGIKTCYIGTIGCYIDNDVVELSNTTPDILELYNLLLTAKEKGCKVIVMEVSSHSLAEERIKGLKFDVCAFTNLSQDHLDYHKTMEEYCKCKAKIVNYLKDKGKIIVNVDDEYSKYFICDKSLSLGINGSNYKIKEFHMENTHTDILFNVNNDSYEVRTNLIGKFNVYNYLTSLALINNLGISVNDIINVTDSINAPVGRAQIIKVGTSIAVIDYAHKPDAVSKIIPLFREVTKGKIITIIGCGGDRDPMKRPIMGNIATSLSDYVILTNDNPRTEDEKLIMKDILEGITTDNYEVIYDRKDAIKKGISMLKDNDCLLILGKGHEDYQIIGRTKIHLSDYEEVIKNINK